MVNIGPITSFVIKYWRRHMKGVKCNLLLLETLNQKLGLRTRTEDWIYISIVIQILRAEWQIPLYEFYSDVPVIPIKSFFFENNTKSLLTLIITKISQFLGSITGHVDLYSLYRGGRELPGQLPTFAKNISEFLGNDYIPHSNLLGTVNWISLLTSKEFWIQSFAGKDHRNKSAHCLDMNVLRA